MKTIDYISKKAAAYKAPSGAQLAGSSSTVHQPILYNCYCISFNFLEPVGQKLGLYNENCSICKEHIVLASTHSFTFLPFFQSVDRYRPTLVIVTYFLFHAVSKAMYGCTGCCIFVIFAK